MTGAVAGRHPPWLKVRAPGGPGFAETRAAVKEMQIKYGLPADSWPTSELTARLQAR